MLSRRRKSALAALVVAALAGGGFALSQIGPSGPGTTTITTTTHTTAAGFVAGVCRGSCAPSPIRRYNLNVPDSGSIAYCRPNCLAADATATNTPVTITPAIFISRPAGLADASAPLVVAFSGSVPGDPDWLAAAAADRFVYVSVPTTHGCDVSCQYADPTVAVEPIGAGATGTVPLYQDCGGSRHAPCDDIPWVADVIRALESCTTATAPAGGPVGTWVAAGDPIAAWGSQSAQTGNGAPPCEHVDPHEVFAEGGSRGGLMSEAVACDTRTSALIAAATVVSATLTSADPTGTQAPPNCPALLGVGRHCVADCVAAPANHNLSLQYIWGDEDPNFPHTQGPGWCDRTNPANDCLGEGYHEGAGGRWVFGAVQLATTVLGGPALGCSTSPAATSVTGTTGKITVTTYGGCTDPGAATQTIRVSGGGHLPDTWPLGGVSNITCSSRCVDLESSDGLSDPAAAWSFWTAYLP